MIYYSFEKGQAEKAFKITASSPVRVEHTGTEDTQEHWRLIGN